MFTILTVYLSVLWAVAVTGYVILEYQRDPKWTRRYPVWADLLLVLFFPVVVPALFVWQILEYGFYYAGFGIAWAYRALRDEFYEGCRDGSRR